MMDMKKVKYFIEVVEQKSILKAAESLFMTQPPLSTAIRNLEKELGVELFERRGKRLKLTGTGEVFYQRAKELVDSTEEIKSELQCYDQGTKGTVKIGCSSIVNFLLIPKVMEKIHKRNLDFVIEVSEGNALFILDSLQQNELDVGIVRSVFKEKDITLKKLYDEPLMLALPFDHHLNHKKEPIHIADLKNEDFLMQSTTYGYNISELIIQECSAYGFYPNIVYWGTETLPILNMVQKGLGIAITPKSFAKLDHFKLPKLVELEKEELRSTLSIATYNRKVKKRSTDMFIQLLEEVIEEMNFI